MFGPLPVFVAIVGLAMLSAGGLAYALLYRRIETENKVGRRIDQIQTRGPVATDVGVRVVDAAKRRKSVQETLKELDEKQRAKNKKSKSPPLSLRLQQAGLSWDRRTFLLFSAGCGIAFAVLAYLLHGPLYAVAALGFAGALGFPRWVINFLRKRRTKKFLNEFANAMDVIVRGVKAGLPLNDCLRIIAAEACARLPERVPVPESSFFAIVITIQQKAGGNLSEALGNLSRVLRERKKMFGKIKAMSMEAKASAWIIGSLPVIVMGLVYLSSPQYISLLFTDPTGHLILGASALWMFIGIMVMRKMINFDV